VRETFGRRQLQENKLDITRRKREDITDKIEREEDGFIGTDTENEGETQTDR
jgi:hypothetical protein